MRRLEKKRKKERYFFGDWQKSVTFAAQKQERSIAQLV